MAFDDKTFLQQPDRWPSGICHMKRRVRSSDRSSHDGFGQFWNKDGKPTVVVIDIVALCKVREESYPDLDALLKEWMVD